MTIVLAVLMVLVALFCIYKMYEGWTEDKQLSPVTQAEIEKGKYGHPFNPVDVIKESLKLEAPPEGYWWEIEVGAKDNGVVLKLAMRDMMTQTVTVIDECRLDEVVISYSYSPDKKMPVSEYYASEYADANQAKQLFQGWARRVTKDARMEYDSKYQAVYEQEIIS